MTKFSKIVKYLYSLRSSKGINLTLERIENALNFFGNPQNNFKAIHIAGTKGKGSVSYMLSSILSKKYNVGLYISPHLTDIRERIQINGKKISKREFCKIFEKVKNVIENLNLTFFEALTLIAFLYFSEKKVNIAIIEVGMGGKYDATNVINPLLTIITNISIDHEEFLGKDEISIAKEKAGIIKNNVPLITCVEQKEILDLFKKFCEEKNSLLMHLNNFPESKKYKRSQKFFYNNNEFKIPLLGKHQIRNAICAIKAIEILNENFNFKVSYNEIYNGLRNLKIPGRIEIFRKNPFIIIDVAHNSASFKSLCETIVDLRERENFDAIFVIGILKYKNIRKIFEEIIKISNLIKFIILTKPNYELSCDVFEMKKILDDLKFDKEKILLSCNVEEGIEKALEIKNNNLIIITGSFFTAGEALKILKRKFNR